MNSPFHLFALIFGALLCHATLHAEEARAAVYVVDRSEVHAVPGGAAFKYSPAIATGKDREVLALAKAPAGSTLIMIAYQKDNLFRNLPPVIVEQTSDSKPARFPADESPLRWTYDSTDKVDLYIVALHNDDPQLERLREYLDWLKDSLSAKKTETTMLYALALKNRLSNLHRSSNAEILTVDFPNLAPSKPTAKATTTRGPPFGKIPKSTPEPLPETAEHHSAKELDALWEEDSRPVSFGPAKPGILIFPISTPADQ